MSRKAMEERLEYFLRVICPLAATRVDQFVQLAIKEMPKWEGLILDVFEIMFSPRQLFRQLVIISAVQLVIMFGVALEEAGNSIVVFLSKAEREQKKVMQELSTATSYREWKAVAERLDYLRGNDKWRLQDESSLFDCNVLRKRIRDTMEMAQQGDVFRLMFRLRGGLARDQYGMQHEGLFSRAISGTKTIVEQYHESVAYALDFICDSQIEDEEIPTDAKLAFFNETRHAYGRSALLLSGDVNVKGRVDRKGREGGGKLGSKG
jgi:TAG lipase / steryl ester hydrolase / phospholipase A2 / LPA acyltransferase